MASSDTFNRLIVGLAQYDAEVMRNENASLPDVLQHCMNELALLLKEDFPKTVSGLFRLLADHPVQTWYPAELPSDFDPEARLLEQRTLSYEVIEYLDHLAEESDANLETVSRTGTLNLLLQNRRFRIVRDKLQELFITDPILAQHEYVKFRRYLIENPFTTIMDIEATFFSSKSVVTVQEIAEFYEEADHLRVRTEHGIYECWNCPHCGPLRVFNGELKSIKESACGRHCPRHEEGWKPRRYTRDLLVLSEGIHLRTHIPGIAELSLYHWLGEIREKYTEQMDMPELWPGIDIYDIRIPFRDGVWAVDVKDYKDPYQLGAHLKGIQNRGNLRWSNAFYVYPAYREAQRSRYGEIVRRSAEKTRHGAMICNDKAFRKLVTDKLDSLTKGK